jgi:hypothetical protein
MALTFGDGQHGLLDKPCVYGLPCRMRLPGKQVSNGVELHHTEKTKLKLVSHLDSPILSVQPRHPMAVQRIEVIVLMICQLYPVEHSRETRLAQRNMQPLPPRAHVFSLW